jgi:hypothetical protein
VDRADVAERGEKVGRIAAWEGEGEDVVGLR